MWLGPQPPAEPFERQGTPLPDTPKNPFQRPKPLTPFSPDDIRISSLREPVMPTPDPNDPESMTVRGTPIDDSKALMRADGIRMLPPPKPIEVTPDNWPQPGQSVPTPDQVKDVANNIANPELSQHLQDLRARMIALQAPPTYVDKYGNTVSGSKDTNGRLRSGLKGMLSGLAQGGPVRDWADVLGNISRGIAAGATGAIVPEWDENIEREQEKQRLAQEIEQATKWAMTDAQLEYNRVRNETNLRRVSTAERQLQERIEARTIKDLHRDKSQALQAIFKRGFYYEGDNPEEDAMLQRLGIVLADFDSTKKPIQDTDGRRKAYNPQTRQYESIEGTAVDPDQQAVTFSVDGKTITTTARRFLGYAGVKEQGQLNRDSRERIAATQLQQQREIAFARLKQQAEQFNARLGVSKVQAKAAIRQKLTAGDLTQDEANELEAIIDSRPD